MAQRLRARRENCQPAAYIALAGFACDQNRNDGAARGHDESLDGAGSPPSDVAAVVRRGALRRATWDYPYLKHMAREHAQRELLPGSGDLYSGGLNRSGVGFALALGMYLSLIHI